MSETKRRLLVIDQAGLMKLNTRTLLVVAALVGGLLGCRLPLAGGSAAAQVPTALATLTSLVIFTPTASGTLTPSPAATSTTMRTPTPTPTQTVLYVIPTYTPRPPTPTDQALRPHLLVKAPFLATPPRLDGDWSEYEDLTDESPANNIVYGSEYWLDEHDLQGSFYAGWDNNFLYIAVKVIDDRYAQNATGTNLYKGDSLEILLDTMLKEDIDSNRFSEDDFQLGISPGRTDTIDTQEAYLWIPRDLAGPRSDVQIATRLHSGFYQVEVAIPWTVFWMTPQAGMELGFILSISDNDDLSRNIQESMASSVAQRRRTDPTTWGELFLIK